MSWFPKASGWFVRILKWLVKIPWNAVGDIALHVIIWLLLGSAINLFPVLIAYFLGVGEENGANNSTARSYTLNSVLSVGDLLVAAAVMLPPVLADLALNVKKATRTRTLVIILGSVLSIVSIVFYGFAYANNLSRESHKAPVAINLTPDLVATWSKNLFLGAVALGAVCAGFLALEKSSSKETKAGEKNDSAEAANEPER